MLHAERFKIIWNGTRVFGRHMSRRPSGLFAAFEQPKKGAGNDHYRRTEVECFMLARDETDETHDTAWKQFKTTPGASSVGIITLIIRGS